VKVLFIASRPPWPPTDGGRVLMAHTIDGLLARGHEVTVVAPTTTELVRVPVSDGLRVHLIPDRRPPRLAAALVSLVQGRPVTVVMQASAPARVEVARLIGATAFDVVHVQQLQALPKADAAWGRGIPIVLRAENVESDLWHALSATRPLMRPFAAFEAHRLARFEARALARVAATAALTQADAQRLRRLAPEAQIEVVPAPMPPVLPAGTMLIAGDPALVIVASRWHPNQEGLIWFVRTIWPSIRSALPGAKLHVFGADPAVDGPGIERHGWLPNSQDAYASGSILIVPLRIASGVRIRILEAWARGVPVVATRSATEGLDLPGERGVRIADTADAFVRHIRELHASPDARIRQVEEGRALLAARHDPNACAVQLEQLYARVIAKAGA
jgi:glycosyltransferase involved in cell wall biosynthesis